MKVYIWERDPMRRNVDLFFVSEAPGVTRLLHHEGGGTWREEQVPEGADLEQPTITMPREWAEALLSALQGHGVAAPDQFVVKALERAEGRVDKMLGHLLGESTP